MDPKRREIAAVHVAIDREKDAIGLYLKLAAAVRDPKAKDVLIHLAQDEVGHMDKLERHLSSVISGNPGLLVVSDIADAMAARLAEGPGVVFPTAGELARTDEIRILDLALELELAANRRYIELAASAGPEGGEIFLSLAKEEEMHAKILRAEIDSIGQNGFWFDLQEFTMEQ